MRLASFAQVPLPPLVACVAHATVAWAHAMEAVRTRLPATPSVRGAVSLGDLHVSARHLLQAVRIAEQAPGTAGWLLCRCHSYVACSLCVCVRPAYGRAALASCNTLERLTSCVPVASAYHTAKLEAAQLWCTLATAVEGWLQLGDGMGDSVKGGVNPRWLALEVVGSMVWQLGSNTSQVRCGCMGTCAHVGGWVGENAHAVCRGMCVRLDMGSGSAGASASRSTGSCCARS